MHRGILFSSEPRSNRTGQDEQAVVHDEYISQPRIKGSIRHHGSCGRGPLHSGSGGAAGDRVDRP